MPLVVKVGVATFELWPSSGGYVVKAAHGPKRGNHESYVGLSLGKGQNPSLWPRGPMQALQKAVNRA
jgi:hypothetical protein